MSALESMLSDCNNYCAVCILICVCMHIIMSVIAAFSLFSLKCSVLARKGRHGV